MERDEGIDLAVRILKASVTPDETSAASILDEGGLNANMLQVAGVGRIVDEPDQIIKDARRDPDAFDVLRFGAAQQISTGQTLPVQISLWIADFLLGKIERPAATAGRHKSVGLHHQAFSLVEMLVQCGFTATRNDASSHRNSACDLVAEAMAQHDRKPNSYSGVRSIYLAIKSRRRPDGSIRTQW